jgi:hypothetical protein
LRPDAFCPLQQSRLPRQVTIRGKMRSQLMAAAEKHSGKIVSVREKLPNGS